MSNLYDAVANLQVDAESLIQEFMEEYDLTYALLYVYSPLWNDGSPCNTHYYSVSSSDCLFDYLYEDLDEDDPVPCLSERCAIKADNLDVWFSGVEADNLPAMKQKLSRVARFIDSFSSLKTANSELLKDVDDPDGCLSVWCWHRAL